MMNENGDESEPEIPAAEVDATGITGDDSGGAATSNVPESEAPDAEATQPEATQPEATQPEATQPEKSRTGLIVGGTVIAAVAVAAVAAVVLLSGPTTAPSEMTAAQASALADGLNARDPNKLADVLADPAVAQDPAVAGSVIADGESVSIDPASLEVEGDVAFVRARIEGPEPSTLTFFLVDVDGTWKIAGSTAPKPDAAQ